MESKEVKVVKRVYDPPVEVPGFSVKRPNAWGRRISAPIGGGTILGVAQVVGAYDLLPELKYSKIISGDLRRYSYAHVSREEVRREEWGDTTIIYEVEHVSEYFWYNIDPVTARIT